MTKQPPRYNIGPLTHSEHDSVLQLMRRLAADSTRETVRRSVTTMHTLMDHMDTGGDVVLCKKGVADRVVWFI